MEKKIALITGATSGIGAACARRFAHEGYDLILAGRNQEKLHEISLQLQKEGTDVLTLAFDITDREAAMQAVSQLNDRWSQIDVLINNAGLALGLEKEYEGNMDEWDTMIDTNIKGLLTMTRLFVPKD